MLCNRQACLLALRSSLRSSSLFVHREIKINGDKFYSRKFMWAAGEKLIIDEVGP